MSNKQDILLSIIVVSYNTADLTQQTIQSIFDSLVDEQKWSNLLEVLVVDNNSTDSSVNKIKLLLQKYPVIKLIENQENLGFAKANNLAAKNAAGKYLLLLNSDTIVQKGALEKLISGAERNNLAVAAPTLLNQDLTYQAQGGDLPNLFTLLNHYWLLDDLPLIGKYLPSTQKTGLNFADLPENSYDQETHTTIIPSGWVGGTAMLVEKEYWQKVNGLAEEIFMYGEDVEFCHRIFKLGGKIGQVMEAKIVHLGSASSSSANALIGEIKGYLFFFAKHRPTWQMPLLKFIIKVGITLRLIIFSLFKSNPDKVKAYKEANQLF